jgi:oligopeptide/dipeptide ABC transporter ATP-binding protein
MIKKGASNLPILEARGIRKYYSGGGGLFSRHRVPVKAVDDVDVVIERGHTLGLVGESGCGKSTLARVLLMLEEPTSGEIMLNGTDFLSLRGRELRRARRSIQMVFQDPYSSLNPRMTVGSTIAEGIKIHHLARGREVTERVHILMEKVGLSPSASGNYPHEFSGGQRQRVGIARALSVEPDIVVADEPVSALDVSVQAQIINLFTELQKDLGLTYLFISHDLGVVKHISDTISVMYLGRIVESAPAQELFEQPLHPYTDGLLASIPRADPAASTVKASIKGDVPSPIDIPPGCSFHTRCPHTMERCRHDIPPLVKINHKHWVRCWLSRD